MPTLHRLELATCPDRDPPLKLELNFYLHNITQVKELEAHLRRRDYNADNVWDVVTGGAEQVDAGVLLGAEFNIDRDPEHPSPFAKFRLKSSPW